NRLTPEPVSPRIAASRSAKRIDTPWRWCDLTKEGAFFQSRPRRGRVLATGNDFDSKVKILIADGYPIFREGLKQVLSTQEDFEVLGEAADSVEALRLMDLLKPDVLLLDMAMPPLNGMEVLERGNGNLRTTRVII